MAFISWTIFGQYLDVTSNVLMSGLHRNRPLVMATNILQSLRKEGRIEKVGGSTRSARYGRLRRRRCTQKV